MIICAAKVGMTIKLELPEATIAKQTEFLRRFDHLGHVVAKEMATPAKYRLPAGEGTILFEELPSGK